ncbi:integrin beta-2-like isoform X2 [Cyprinodon tularosa]|nr:integrin beta-2-like isoform X2 [Cyprinodon tularosa]
MDLCMLSLLLLMLGKHGFCHQEEVCTNSVTDSCDGCITFKPFCAWCQQLNYTKPGEQETVRCGTKAKLIERGCKPEEIISPQNHEIILQKDPLSQSSDTEEPVQMSPQKIHLKLRPGLPHSFNVTFKRAEGYPVDLYYLMDLSYSMKDDLENVKGLGKTLFDALNSITKKAKIGFGAFVDKTVLPYTNTNKEKLKKPCDENDDQCQAAFGYRHVLSMTSSEEQFREEVAKQYISGNLDSPEGSLDAMMQAAVCGDQIGWRNSSTRLIVLATDAGFHMAGDGKLAGILEPHDEQCHIKNNLYVKSNEMDYPSVGQLAIQLEKNNVQPIFAVTENVKDVYTKLSKIIPKSEVGVLSSDSKNVVQLIESAYKKLSSKVTLTHDVLPDNVQVKYLPVCDHPREEGTNKGVCDQVGEGKEIYFQVTVTAKTCIEQESFTISPLGIKDKLTVTISTNCTCECNNHGESNQKHCNNNGRINCGVCSCNDGFSGQRCGCNVTTQNLETLQALCRRDNGTECEGRGDCLCGSCKCHEAEQGFSYYGKFCECDDEHCEKFNNKKCAGNGDCECGKCKCFDGWEGSACQCSETLTEGCRPPPSSSTDNNTICFGRGSCKCNLCECDEGYQRPFCEKCEGCDDVCQTKMKCIECLFVNSDVSKEDCKVVCGGSMSHTLVENFTYQGKDCNQKDSQGCRIKFKLEQLSGRDNYKAEILKIKDCPEPQSVMPIIIGSIAAVAVIGILLLMLIKFYYYLKDLKEFKRFENERQKTKWDEIDNPLFQNPTTTVANPLFTGEN